MAGWKCLVSLGVNLLDNRLEDRSRGPRCVGQAPVSNGLYPSPERGRWGNIVSPAPELSVGLHLQGAERLRAPLGLSAP